MTSTNSTHQSRSRCRRSLFGALDNAHDLAISTNGYVVVSGKSGSGKVDTVAAWLEERHPSREVIVECGDKVTSGYLAGFFGLVERCLAEAERAWPEIVSEHQQSLKRLFPDRESDAFTVPKDLTGLAVREERTRFYHHEYQAKLLNGLHEFLAAYLAASDSHVSLVIDRADQLSPTGRRFLEIATRRGLLDQHLHLMLLSDESADITWREHGQEVVFDLLTIEEASDLLGRWSADQLTDRMVRELWLCSKGNAGMLSSLLTCVEAETAFASYLTSETQIDLYLSQLDQRYRFDMLADYVANHCTDDDPVVMRNYDTFDAGTRERLHRAQLQTLADSPDEVRHPVHHLSLGEASDQVVALAPISIALQEIGLYDTWFDLFSRFWSDPQLRTLPGGGELHNLAYLRMAFVLYSLGLAPTSIRYLESFYQHFPRSLFTPTVLYSQSMAHGRYQVPPDLEEAEKYATLNLEKIDSEFLDHPKHPYIKVFAENALAYIRARQGRLDESMELCTQGFDRMQDIYGEDRFALHQSILMYNTAQIYELSRNFEKAREVYSRTIELDPYYGEYANDMANLLQHHGQTDEAIGFYSKAIELCPPYYEAHLNRARLYFETDEFDLAEADYLRVIELHPSGIQAHLGMSALCLHQDRCVEAVEHADRAIYLEPANAQAWNNRGLGLARLERSADAEESFQASVTHDPNLAAGWSNLAELLFSSGKLDDCRGCLDEAIELSNDPDYSYNRAVLNIEVQQWDDALADVTEAERRGGDAEELTELRVRISEAMASA